MQGEKLKHVATYTKEDVFFTEMTQRYVSESRLAEKRPHPIYDQRKCYSV